uniref:Uncharacterized protein n=1 Tax=Opuntia streptacantha TaxID=393608 RepID=A0A7C8YND9_OPUST
MQLHMHCHVQTEAYLPYPPSAHVYVLFTLPEPFHMYSSCRLSSWFQLHNHQRGVAEDSSNLPWSMSALVRLCRRTSPNNNHVVERDFDCNEPPEERFPLSTNRRLGFTGLLDMIKF